MKKFLIAFVLLATSLAAVAQPTEENAEKRKERIEASKVAFITSYLSLNTEEAEKFWPVYNEYQDAKKALRPEGKRPRMESLSDAEATTMLNDVIVMETKKAELKAEYLQKFRGVISDRKVLLLSKAEGEFRKQIVKRYADRRGEGKRKGAGQKKS